MCGCEGETKGVLCLCVCVLVITPLENYGAYICTSPRAKCIYIRTITRRGGVIIDI